MEAGCFQQVTERLSPIAHTGGAIQRPEDENSLRLASLTAIAACSSTPHAMFAAGGIVGMVIEAGQAQIGRENARGDRVAQAIGDDAVDILAGSPLSAMALRAASAARCSTVLPGVRGIGGLADADDGRPVTKIAHDHALRRAKSAGSSHVVAVAPRLRKAALLTFSVDVFGSPVMNSIIRGTAKPGIRS